MISGLDDLRITTIINAHWSHYTQVRQSDCLAGALSVKDASAVATVMLAVCERECTTTAHTDV